MNKITIQSQQRQAFLQIFGMFAVQGKLVSTDFIKLVRSIGVTTASEHLERMIDKIFAGKLSITSEQFMKKVYILNVDYPLLELQQYFQLLAVSDNDLIPIQKIKRILVNENKSDLEIYDIIMSLKPYMDGDLLNYKKFVQQFF